MVDVAQKPIPLQKDLDFLNFEHNKEPRIYREESGSGEVIKVIRDICFDERMERAWVRKLSSKSRKKKHRWITEMII